MIITTSRTQNGTLFCSVTQQQKHKNDLALTLAPPHRGPPLYPPPPQQGIPLLPYSSASMGLPEDDCLNPVACRGSTQIRQTIDGGLREDFARTHTRLQGREGGGRSPSLPPSLSSPGVVGRREKGKLGQKGLDRNKTGIIREHYINEPLTKKTSLTQIEELRFPILWHHFFFSELARSIKHYPLICACIYAHTTTGHKHGF